LLVPRSRTGGKGGMKTPASRINHRNKGRYFSRRRLEGDSSNQPGTYGGRPWRTGNQARSGIEGGERDRLQREGRRSVKGRNRKVLKGEELRNGEKKKGGLM